MYLSVQPHITIAFLILKKDRGAVGMDKMIKCFACKQEDLSAIIQKNLVIAVHTYPSIGDKGTEIFFKLDKQSV